MKTRKTSKRKQRIENLKFTIGLFIIMCGLPLAMFTHWLLMGY